MKLLKVVTLLIICMAPKAYAQESRSNRTNYVEVFSTAYDGSQLAFHIRPDNRYSEIKGSPYLDESWKTGKIFLRNDTLGSTFPMRYNIYANEMQFINRSDTLAISNPLMVRTIFLDGHRFEYLPFILNGNENMAWFDVLVTGKTRLLLRHGVRLESGTAPVTPYHCQNAQDHFVASKTYYFQVAGAEMPAEIPRNRNALAGLPVFNRPEIREFIKTKRINPRDATDLVTLFYWINQTPSDK